MNECHLAVEEKGSSVSVFATFEAVVKLETVWSHMAVILIRCHYEYCPCSTRSTHVIGREASGLSGSRITALASRSWFLIPDQSTWSIISTTQTPVIRVDFHVYPLSPIHTSTVFIHMPTAFKTEKA